MSKKQLCPRHGLFSWLAKLIGSPFKMVEKFLKFHPKIIARKLAASNLAGRGNGELQVILVMRFLLPLTCEHRFATVEDGDEIFFGNMKIKQADGEHHQHLELIRAVKDDYKAP